MRPPSSNEPNVRSWLALPGGLRGAVATPRLASVVGVVLVAVLLVVILLGRWWWKEAESAEQRIAPQAATLSTSAPVPSPADPRIGTATAAAPAIAPATENATGVVGTAGGAADSREVVVHVAGRVRKPGVVTLASGARVEEAVRKAGGLGPGADPVTVNLARPVVDGEQIIVLAKGEAPPPAVRAPANAGAAGGAGAAGAGGGAKTKIDLNSADQAALEALPGVGPVLAGRILDWRAQHGRFSSVDELAEVSGVGEKTFARLAPLVTV